MDQDTTECEVERFGTQWPQQATQLSGLRDHRDPPATTTTTSTANNSVLQGSYQLMEELRFYGYIV